MARRAEVMRVALNRRGFLVACSAAAAAAFVPAAALRGREPQGLVVFDSRIAASAAFARRYLAAGISGLDVATQDAQFWRAVRRDLALRPGTRIDGVCCWSDWVNLRAEFAARRLRVRHERRLPDGSFAWSMA